MTISTVPPVETIAPGLVTKVRDGDLAGTQWGLIAAGIAALIASVLLASGDAMAQQAYFSYLVAYMFALSLVLGALFFVMLHHLTRAGWSVVVRRVAENVMAVMPFMAVLFIPIVVGSGELYHWLHPVEGDAVLAGKAVYLNATFFYIRAGIYFAIWIALAFWFRRTSLKQDQTGDPQLTLKMARVAAPGMLLFSFTITFAAFDWIMSLDPHWYSTIFGVCYFAGSFMAILAYLTLLCLWLNRRGYLKGSVTVEHYHDLGKLMFAFMVFWTYVNFSQYFLIWYANPTVHAGHHGGYTRR